MVSAPLGSLYTPATYIGQVACMQYGNLPVLSVLGQSRLNVRVLKTDYKQDGRLQLE